jgi:hypothetical protein
MSSLPLPQMVTAGAILAASLIPVFVPAVDVRPEPMPTTVNVVVHQVCEGEGATCRFER